MKIQSNEEMLDTNDIIKKSNLFSEEKQKLVDEYFQIYKIQPVEDQTQFSSPTGFKQDMDGDSEQQSEDENYRD